MAPGDNYCITLLTDSEQRHMRAPIYENSLGRTLVHPRVNIFIYTNQYFSESLEFIE